MTRLNLLDALTSFTNEVMREILLPVRRQKGDEEEPAERPPFVYRQRLPDVKSSTSKAPYILHQIVTGEDEQKPGEPTDSSVEVRSLFCVYGEDDQEGALRLHARLNQLYTQTREVEVAAITALHEGNQYTRSDILETLNWLSSAFRVMMFMQLAGEYK